MENGWPQQLAIEEHSHAAMANAYEAGAAGLPCAIFRGYIGGDLPKVNPNIKLVTCPFTGEELAAVPAIRPDVAMIHAQRADKAGNVMIEGMLGVQKEAVLAAKRSVVTVEEIVDDFGPSAASTRWSCRTGPSAIRECRAAPFPPMRKGYYQRNNAFYKHGTRSRASATRSWPGWKRTCWTKARRFSRNMRASSARRRSRAAWPTTSRTR